MPRTGATRAEFEAKISDGSDLVGAWCEYVRWAESQPGGAAVLERACLDLAKHPQHRNDVRHLRLWVLHADTLESPLKVGWGAKSRRNGSTSHRAIHDLSSHDLFAKILWSSVTRTKVCVACVGCVRWFLLWCRVRAAWLFSCFGFVRIFGGPLNIVCVSSFGAPILRSDHQNSVR